MAEYEQRSVCSEDTGSICDEERIRKLFQVCDANGDGFIDSNDLSAVCRELNLEHSLQDLMLELGADENGRISYEEFLRRRLALKPEIEALRNPDLPQVTTDYLPTSSDTSLGGTSGNKERWEFDSGARDLSPEPNTLQRLVEAAGGSVNSNNPASLLQLANKLHMAAVASLRAEVSELSTKLVKVTEERDFLKTALTKQQIPIENESLVEQYEERLTELHSVIAELSRKVERQCTLVIEEEAASDVVADAELSADSCSLTEMEPAHNKVLNIQVGTSKKERRKSESERSRSHSRDHGESSKDNEAECNEARALNSPKRNNIERLGQCIVDPPITKMAERVKLHTILTGDLVTDAGSAEAEKLRRKLERVKADNTVLQLSLHESKEYSERLTLLVGKYESNLTALKLALNSAECALDLYHKIDCLLQSLIPSNTKRSAREFELREQLRAINSERSLICGTVVSLESYVEPVDTPPCGPESIPRIDLETAVLVQEMMRERDERGEAWEKLAVVENERDKLELKLRALELKEQEYLNKIQHLQYLVECAASDGDGSRRDGHFNEKLTRSLERQFELTTQLKNANSSLLQSLERHKKKSQVKIRKLESQILTLVEHHANQVRALKHRIFELEELVKDANVALQGEK